MNFNVILGVFALLHVYIGLRLLPALQTWPWAWGCVAVALGLSLVLVPGSIFGRRAPSARVKTILSWTGYLSMGLFSGLFVLTFLRDLALGLMSLIESVAPNVLPDFLTDGDLKADSALLVSIVAVLASVVGFINARRTASVASIDVPIAGLPAGLDGFTIAQISDVHVGTTIRAPYVQAIVDRVNTLKADMVAITGDLVDGSVADLGDHVAPLADLLSRHGTFFVTGNHDYYSGAEAWIARLRCLNMRVLLNEHAVLEHGRELVVVGGVTDFKAHQFIPSHRTNPHAAITGAPANAAFKLLLAHQPLSAKEGADAGFDLQICGHTHGGQFLPWNFFVRLQQPFTAGLHRVRDMLVYVSRGTGYWGPPHRLGAPSEITLLRLVPQS